MHLLGIYNVYLFDLDNTLYRETDYLFPAYDQVADYIFQKTGIESSEISKFLREEFFNAGRKHLMNKIIEKFRLKNISIPELLNLLRTANPPTIKLFEDAYQCLLTLKKNNKKIAVITNGTIQQQKNKIAHIDWKELSGYIDFVFADETKRKPSPESINHYLVKNNFSPGDVVFIGDSVEDEQAASSAGISFIKSFFKR